MPIHLQVVRKSALPLYKICNGEGSFVPVILSFLAISDFFSVFEFLFHMISIIVIHFCIAFTVKLSFDRF